LAPAVLDQARQLAPLQLGQLAGIQPLAALVFAQVAERAAPAQAALVEREQHAAEQRFVPVAHAGSFDVDRADQSSRRATRRGLPPAKGRCSCAGCSMSARLQQRSSRVSIAYTAPKHAAETSRVGSGGQWSRSGSTAAAASAAASRMRAMRAQSARSPTER